MRLSRGQLHTTHHHFVGVSCSFHICGWAWTFGELELSAVGDTDLALNESSTGATSYRVLVDAENLLAFYNVRLLIKLRTAQMI